MNSQLINDSTIQGTLSEAATQLKNHFIREEGSAYSVEDLQQALSNWLELSVESLLDDVLFHVLEGDRAYAFNRRAFELEMQRLQTAQSEQPSQNASESTSEPISKVTDSQVAA
ncbi:MAG: hypothetical protein KME11_13080 [Timaviella obliquedivisa GSE-PSE-MK23-08B]|jgi:hypothetical protein|nr:hypothetical protein [Timaviella obliquedivisa GSE-PSE-MK23-08B]